METNARGACVRLWLMEQMTEHMQRDTLQSDFTVHCQARSPRILHDLRHSDETTITTYLLTALVRD